MKFEHVEVAAVRHVEPPVEVTSAAIEDRMEELYDRIGLVPGRLEMMSGVRARRFWREPRLPSAIATEAGQRIVQEFDPARVQAVAFCAVCRDQLEPASANAVHHALGLPRECQVFDLSNACLGALNGMWLIGSLIELGQIDCGLVVAGEDGRPLVDGTVRRLAGDATVDRRGIKRDFASLTVGSGGAAVLLRRSTGSGPRLLGGVCRADTSAHELCVGGGAGQGELSMATDAEALLEAGLGLARETWAGFAAEHGADWDRVVTHQVGRAHHQRLLADLGLDPSSAAVTFDRFGNVGSVSLPLTLSIAREEGFVQDTHRVALLGIGSGLNCMMMGVGE